MTAILPPLHDDERKEVNTLSFGKYFRRKSREGWAGKGLEAQNNVRERYPISLEIPKGPVFGVSQIEGIRSKHVTLPWRKSIPEHQESHKLVKATASLPVGQS